MSRKTRIGMIAFAAIALFCGGYTAAQAHFGQPKTVLQISIIQFNDGVTDEQEQHVIDGVKLMAAKIPGIKNIWLKAARLEPRDFDAVIVIEFVDRAAADRYAESPVHEAWSRELQRIRKNSISPQVTNP
jgi:hypothetical protein